MVENPTRADESAMGAINRPLRSQGKVCRDWHGDASLRLSMTVFACPRLFNI
jgi:hypothetical protein